MRGAAARLRGLSIGVLAGVVCAGPSFAQDLAVTPLLRSGDRFSLTVTRIRENSSRPQQDGRLTTSIDVHVVSAAGDGVILEWAPGAASFDAPIVQDPLLAGAARALSGMVLRIALKGDGEFVGLVNEAEVVPKLQSATDAIVNGLAGQVPPEQRKAFTDLVAQILSPRALLASSTREAQMYFGLNGLELGVGKSIEFDIDQPNPLGSGVLPTLVRISAESATPDSAVFRTRTTYDGAALLRLTRALVEQSGARLSTDELAKIPTIDMEEHGAYLLDRATGLMREAIVSRRVVAGTERRLDQWEIRLSKPPAR